MSFGSYHSPLLQEDCPRIYLWNFAAKNKLWKYKGPHNTLSRVYTQGILGHSVCTHVHKWSSHSHLSNFLVEPRLDFFIFGRLKTIKIKTNWKETQKKHISDLEPEALIPNDKIRNHYKESKIRITLLIEYLKARILSEIRITPQARSIMSSLNDSLIKYLNARTLDWDSNHSTSKIDHVELEWFYMQPKTT